MDRKIRIYNRETKRIEEERVFERWFMDFFYGHPLGLFLSDRFLKYKPFSRIYGFLKERSSSRKEILNFIQKYRVPIDEIEHPLDTFSNFSEFFSRKLKPSARPINTRPHTLIAPADARLLVYYLNNGTVIPVKGCRFSVGELIHNWELAAEYSNGICLVFRLAPADYHRFCYIDDGEHGAIINIQGSLHSVSPLSLMHQFRVFQENEREYGILHTRNFKSVLQVDVGAMVVGRITQFKRNGGFFHRGQEKGYFAPGGSTIVLIFKPETVTIDADICHYSEQGIETLVKYGSAIGRSFEKPQLDTGRI